MDKLNLSINDIIGIVSKDYVKQKDAEEIVKAIVETLKTFKQENEKILNTHKNEIGQSVNTISTNLYDLNIELKELINNAESASLKQIKDLSNRLNDEVKNIKATLSNLPSLAPYEAKLSELEASIKAISEPQPLDNPQQIADKVNTLSGIIEPKVIKGWTDIENNIRNIQNVPKDFDVRIGVSSTAIKRLTDRVVSLESNPVGGGVTVETPSGTVDDSNVTFTVTATPKYLVINGLIYFENAGYTLSGLTITLSDVVGTGGVIRSIS